MGEHHHDAGLDPTLALVLLLAGLATLGYLAAVRHSRRLTWPWHRTLCWVVGVGLSTLGTAGPLAEAAHRSFVAHAVAHVAVGMAGPLLLVCGAPVTLALRALPAARARRLSRVLASGPVRLAGEPLVAAALSVGGLYLLYLTPLHAAAQDRPGVHLLVQVHLVVSGYLLAAALVGPDPVRHRRSHLHRAVVLVAAAAAHGILAKHLYAYPPEGVGSAAGEAGAMVMYYGGDAVEIVLMVLLCRRWFAVRPRRAAAGRRPLGADLPAA